MASHAQEQLTPRAREIVDAAREILEHEGLDALSMRRIADRLGIRAPSIYKHLLDKQALESALISAGFEEQAERFEAAVRDADDSEPLAAIGEAYRDFAAEHPHLYRLMTERPLDRSQLTPGVEQRANAPLLEAVGGDEERASAARAFAHGMISLEHSGRLAEGTDLDAAWRLGISALAATGD